MATCRVYPKDKLRTEELGLDDERLSGLLAATARGDRRAFHALYDAAAPVLLGIAMRILKRRDVAEDVLQDAFIKIWHNAAEYHPERGRVSAWMICIVRNRAIDVLRRRPDGISDDATDLDEPGPGPAETTAIAKDAERMLRCLGELNENQSRSIALAFFEGLTHGELARRLELPMGTVKTWIRRGLLNLRECLNA